MAGAECGLFIQTNSGNRICDAGKRQITHMMPQLHKCDLARDCLLLAISDRNSAGLVRASQVVPPSTHICRCLSSEDIKWMLRTCPELTDEVSRVSLSFMNEDVKVFLPLVRGFWLEWRSLQECANMLVAELKSSLDSIDVQYLDLPPYCPLIVVQDIVIRETQALWIELLRK